MSEDEDTTLNATNPESVEPSGASLSSGMSQSASELSGKCTRKQPSKSKSDNGSGVADNTTNTGKEKVQVKRPTTRIVQSRFKTAGAISKDSSGGSNSSGNKSNSAGYSRLQKSGLNNTLTTSTSILGKKQIQKPKPVRSTHASKLGPTSRSSSVLKISGSGSQASHQGASLLPQANLESKSNKLDAKKSSRASSIQASNAKLHSTVLNATMLSDLTAVKNYENVFSTTLVGGLAPGGRKLDITGVVLPELPDISAIRLDSNSSGSKTGDATILSSVSENDLSQNSGSSIFHEVTTEELEKEYMSYLQWAYVDTYSEDAFNVQLKNAQIQLLFLEQLVNEKQRELSERKQVRDLILHHQRVSEAHKMQSDLLQTVVDGLPACEEATQVMSQELAKNLHQVKMDNLYVPENHNKYRDQLLEALKTQITLLSDIECLVEPRSYQLNSTINLLGELQNTSQHIQQCENEVHQAARLAVQEASLQIGAKQMNCSAFK
ncbi:hypothetical protein OTU49_002953 [Cherax quadricarinatus]|uniref:HAUS augmin-like complex subunit 8 n=2 Tax=Cherax quadricarinatus TaxID=27406 RepID=A0AAW0X834_CHEQU